MNRVWELLRTWQDRAMTDAGQLGTAAWLMERVLAGQISDHELHIARAWLNRYEARTAADLVAASNGTDGR
jgi:hypothetical protein